MTMTHAEAIAALQLVEADNDLAHYGVPGMKWGQRKADRPSTEQILNARSMTTARRNKIINADADVRLATSKAGQAAALKITTKYAKEIMESDDTRVASMLTKGERVANVIAAGPIGLLVNRSNTKATQKDRWAQRSELDKLRAGGVTV